MTYFIYENASLGTSVFTASATDADLDKGNVITYSMITSVAGEFCHVFADVQLPVDTKVKKDMHINFLVLDVQR